MKRKLREKSQQRPRRKKLGSRSRSYWDSGNEARERLIPATQARAQREAQVQGQKMD